MQPIGAGRASAKKRGAEPMYDAEHFFDGYKANPAYALDCLKAAYEAGARWLVLCDTNGGTLPAEVHRIVSEAAKVLPGDRLGIRPSDIRCVEAETGGGLLAGEIVFAEPRNESVLFNARVEDREIFALAPRLLRPKPKTRIYLELDEDAVHLFDPESGANLNRGSGGSGGENPV